MADNDTLNIRVYDPESFNKLNRDAGFTVHEIDEIDYFDPVLELKPVWVNVQKTGSSRASDAEFGAHYGEEMSEDEVHLESSLLLYLAREASRTRRDR